MRSLTPLVLSALLGFAAPFASAQCGIGDDGLFTGNCCDSVSPILPPFPDFSMRAQWICIEKCDPSLRERAEFKATQPSFIDCDRVVYDAKWVIYSSGGVNIEYDGQLYGKYARTFRERTPNGTTFQVWRFLVNGDFVPTTTSALSSPCLIPTSFNTYGRVHFVGHIDYACNLAGGFDMAVSLQYLPGCISHGLVSQRPGNGDPSRNYYLVAPDNFIVGANQGTEPQGTISGESFRASSIPSGRCFSEERLSPQSLESIFRDCPCVGGGGSMPWVVQKTDLTNVCAGMTTWVPFSITPFSPDGINLQVVGQWANGVNGAYPQNQTLIHYQAFVFPTSPVICDPNLTQRQVLVGVGMKGIRTFGFHPVIAASSDNSIDLVNLVDPNALNFSLGIPATSDIHFGLFVN